MTKLPQMIRNMFYEIEPVDTSDTIHYTGRYLYSTDGIIYKFVDVTKSVYNLNTGLQISINYIGTMEFSKNNYTFTMIGVPGNPDDETETVASGSDGKRKRRKSIKRKRRKSIKRKRSKSRRRYLNKTYI
jgi:hypothetical protein